jgi:hypothetical protein
VQHARPPRPPHRTEVGADDPDLELRVDMAPGILLHRSMLYGESIEDRAVLERMADLVLTRVQPPEP